MTLLYPGPGARVTHEVFEAHSPYGVYPIRELTSLHVSRHSAGRKALGSLPVAVCSVMVGGLAVLAVAVLSQVSDDPAPKVGAMVVAAAAFLLAHQSWRTRKRPHTLWAMYRGERVCLFATRDRLVLAQVARALLRAIEHRHDKASGRDRYNSTRTDHHLEFRPRPPSTQPTARRR